MKANQTIKCLKHDTSGYVQVVGGLVALLLMIIVGILIFWETRDSVDFDEVTETITSTGSGAAIAATTNASAWTVELDNSPTGTSATNITCYNSTGASETYPTFTLSHKTVSVAADAASEFSQVNATYTSNMASSEDQTSSLATTVFDLLPIIALAVVASIIIGVIIGFGAGNKRL